MVGCFGISLIKLYVKRVEKLYDRLGLKSKQIELDNGTTIHCWVPEEIKHQGKPSLILIHGFGGNGCVGWENQIADFTKHFKVYVPDLIFFGKSITSSSQRSEIFQAECLIKLLRQEKVEKVMVAGTSYGGFVAFRMAALDPQMVTKVVIASSGVCMNPSSNDWILNEFNATHIHQVLIPDSVAAQKKSLNLCVYKKAAILPDCLVEDLMNEFGQNKAQKIELLDGLLIGSKNAPPLPTLNQKVLIVWGSHDRVFNLDLGYELQRHLGEKSKLVVIQNAGHVPQMEKAKEYNTIILNFLSEVDS